ncbi:MAG: transcription elongation factor GreA [Eubacteriales bacterium]|nr:transcription elongation factor GreA [Eubacteriales bacterium]
MAIETKTMLTYAGLKKYEEELHNLKVFRRQEVAQKIKVAREQGDLSENADYDAAKDEQSEIERRIDELERILKNAEVVVDEDVDTGKISVGCEVNLFDLEYDEEVTYQIVGSSEANSLKGKISNESPVGAALIGHRTGDTVSVSLPAGDTIEYKVLGIKKID